MPAKAKGSLVQRGMSLEGFKEGGKAADRQRAGAVG